MPNKIYFLTSEIVPFAETYSLAEFSKEVPAVFNERKYDFRLMMPKYGFISERRYILREVIRLREIKFELKGEETIASVKSAFIPNTKVQVYFLEHPHLFNTPQLELYQTQENASNEERSAYFALSALKTLEYLCWQPEVIICNDWQTAMVPILLKNYFKENEYYQNIKTLLIHHSRSEKQMYSTQFLSELQVQIPELNGDKKVDIAALGAKYSDHVLFLNSDDKNISDLYKKDKNYLSVVSDFEKKSSSFNMKEQSPENWVTLTDFINSLLEKI